MAPLLKNGQWGDSVLLYNFSMKCATLHLIIALLTFIIGASADVAINKAVDYLPPADEDLQSFVFETPECRRTSYNDRTFSFYD